jgi:hypothetical protein
VPNRILREGLLDSESLRAAGEPAEILFTRLLLVADDFGRFDGRLTVICRRCWPNGGPNDEEVTERLQALVRNSLVIMYDAGDKLYLYIPNFRQRTRSPRSKYPPPPDDGHMSDNGQTEMPVDNSKSVEKSTVEINPLPNNALSYDSQVSDKDPTDVGQPSAVGARSSYFGVRISDSGCKPPSSSKSTPRAAAKSLSNTEHLIAESRQAAASAAPMPDHVRAMIAKPERTTTAFNDLEDDEPPNIQAEPPPQHPVTSTPAKFEDNP